MKEEFDSCKSILGLIVFCRADMFEASLLSSFCSKRWGSKGRRQCKMSARREEGRRVSILSIRNSSSNRPKWSEPTKLQIRVRRNDLLFELDLGNRNSNLGSRFSDQRWCWLLPLVVVFDLDISNRPWRLCARRLLSEWRVGLWSC